MKTELPEILDINGIRYIRTDLAAREVEKGAHKLAEKMFDKYIEETTK